MARKEIGTKWDRENRNNMNDNFKELYNKSNSTQKQIDELVLNEGESHLEVVQARIDSEGNSYRTLKERLDTEHDELNTKIDGNHDEVTSQLAQTSTELSDLQAKKMDKNTTDITVNQINKNKGKFDQTYMAEEFLEQMAGNTPINSIPPDGGVTTEKLASKAVSADKTDFAVLSPNLFDKDNVEEGTTIDEDGSLKPSKNRSTSDYIPVNSNSVYITNNTKDNVVLQRYGANFETIGGNSWISKNTPAETTSLTKYIRISVLNDMVETLQLEEGSEPTPYMPYGVISIPNLENKDLIDSIGSIDARLKELEGKQKKTPNTILNFEELTNTTVHKLAMSFDGNLYCFRKDGNTSFYKSDDGGETFEEGFSYSEVSEGGTTTAEGTFVFSDGSVVVITANGKVYRADDFQTNPQVVFEVTEGLKTLSTNAFETADKKYVFFGSYDHTNTKKDMYFSDDGGKSFTKLKDGDTYNDGNNHWHSVAYDPYDNSVWLSQGDGDNSRIYYSKDWINWHFIDGIHPTLIYSFKDRVIFGRDKSGAPPGISQWIKNASVPTKLEDALTFREDRGSFDFYPERTNWDVTKRRDEYYILFPPFPEDENSSYIFATGDGGKSFHLVYHGDNVISQLTGVDKNGYIFGASGKAAEEKLYRAKAIHWD